jgi:hypothetical protein
MLAAQQSHQGLDALSTAAAGSIDAAQLGRAGRHGGLLQRRSVSACKTDIHSGPILAGAENPTASRLVAYARSREMRLIRNPAAGWRYVEFLHRHVNNAHTPPGLRMLLHLV